MRKMSKAAKAEAYDALKRERDALQEYAYHRANNASADAIETIGHRAAPKYFDPYEAYTYFLYGARRVCGGVVACVTYHKDGALTVEVEYFDDWLCKVEKLPHGVGINTELKAIAARLSKRRGIRCA